MLVVQVKVVNNDDPQTEAGHDKKTKFQWCKSSNLFLDIRYGILNSIYFIV